MWSETLESICTALAIRLCDATPKGEFEKICMIEEKDRMKLMTEKQKTELTMARRGSPHNKPIIKLFGGSACTWLLSEYDPETDCFFGLCDLGFGTPELGYVSRKELESVRFKPFNLPVERDLHFKADKTLLEYTEIAQQKGMIET